MPPARFGFYARLSARGKAIYRRSDEIAEIKLPDAAALLPGVAALQRALESASRAATETACQRLGDAICDQLEVRRVRFSILAKRPSRRWGELHGLYDPTAGRDGVVITLWMRTAQRRDIVAFRTFLRTFLHEVGHHLDYELLALGDSPHTQGFYRRESSLLRQLAPDGETRRRAEAPPRTAPTKRAPAARPGAARPHRASPDSAPAPEPATPPRPSPPVQGTLF